MVNTVQVWPEYNELREILQVTVVHVERITKLLWQLSLRGNVFNNWKRNGNSLCFVFICIKFCDAEQHIDHVFQLSHIHIFSYGRKQ